jgi:gamma-tubulin complex component 3
MLLRDLIFVFQGIDGQYIKSDSTTNGYTVLDVGLSAPTKELVYKLSEIGWLYNQVRGYINKNIDTPSIGLVAQSFCAALQHELVGYYKFISILEAQIEKQMSSTAANGLSLKKMFLWTLETQQKLKLMSVLVDACQGKRGE